MAVKLPAVFDPDEVKDYTCDWTDELSDTITSATFDTDITALEIFTTEIDDTGKKATMWIRSSDVPAVKLLAGESVSILHTVNTDGGRKLQRTLTLKIKEN